MRLAEEKKIVPMLVTADYSAGVSMESVNMKNYHRMTLIITNGVTGGSAVLKFYSGAADGGTSSTVNFSYAYGGAAIAAASADYLSATTAVTAASGLTLATGTFSTKMVVCEVNASAMDIDNGEEWLTPVLDAAGSGIAHAVAILEPRYTNNRSLSATI